MYIDLVEQIPDNDKRTLVNYIDKYGVKKSHFMGTSAFLQTWSHSKQKLYQLLGGKLIHSFSIEYNKSEREINADIENLASTHKFGYQYRRFINSLCAEDRIIDSKECFDLEDLSYASALRDTVSMGFKIKAPGKNKLLQISKGMKPIRAMQKVLDYFDATKELRDLFEDFRIKHSLIFNDAKIKSKAFISIHPLDFLTMSDNNSHWQSCMNWRDFGCYKLGTLEMMNSNMVFCCYLCADSPFVFDQENEEQGTWNNKRWRNLFYVTKDIAVAGKGYPFRNEDFDGLFLNEIKRLAKENCGWSYTFGPEYYNDMKHINSEFCFDRARDFIRTNQTTKHNIILDSNIMYNDFVADHQTKHICYRNKVKKTKVLQVSGKAQCLCCGDSLVDRQDDPDGYNDRFHNTETVLCESCSEDFYCEYCQHYNFTGKHYRLTRKSYNKEHNYQMCAECATKYLFVCPCCGEAYMPKGGSTYTFKETLGFYVLPDLNLSGVYTSGNYDGWNWHDDYRTIKRYRDGEPVDQSELNPLNIACCRNCIPKVREELGMKRATIRFGTLTYYTPVEVYYTNNEEAFIKYGKQKNIPEEKFDSGEIKSFIV